MTEQNQDQTPTPEAKNPDDRLLCEMPGWDEAVSSLSNEHKIPEPDPSRYKNIPKRTLIDLVCYQEAVLSRCDLGGIIDLHAELQDAKNAKEALGRLIDIQRVTLERAESAPFLTRLKWLFTGVQV